jgi:hypothetical protein
VDEPGARGAIAPMASTPPPPMQLEPVAPVEAPPSDVVTLTFPAGADDAEIGRVYTEYGLTELRAVGTTRRVRLADPARLGDLERDRRFTLSR